MKARLLAVFTLGGLLAAGWTESVSATQHPLHPLLDVNENGMSDLWERHHNHGQLFSPADPTHAPQADPDADGWSNRLEAIAGTNPFDSQSANTRPALDLRLLEPLSEEESQGMPEEWRTQRVLLTWRGQFGKHYTIERGEGQPLVWESAAATRSSTGGVDLLVLPAATGSAGGRLWRLRIEDADSDEDGLSDYEESLAGTDVHVAESYHGIGDVWMAAHFGWVRTGDDPAIFDPNADHDDDGISNLEEYLAGTDPNIADFIAGAQWLAVRGNGEVGEMQSRSRRMSLPLGGKALLVVGIASEEFPYWTDPQTSQEYNDILGWNLTLDGQEHLSGEVDVNTRHAQWLHARDAGHLLPGMASPTHLENFEVLEAGSEAPLEIHASIHAMNIGDNQLTSSIAIGLLPVELLSRDRFLAGSITLPGSGVPLQVEIFGPEGSLGRFADLHGGGKTLIHRSTEEILATPPHQESAESPSQPAVWFVQSRENPQKIEFYTCANRLGTAGLRFYLGDSPVPVGEMTRELTAASDFSEWIERAEAWIGHAGQTLPPSGNAADPLASALLIPIFNHLHHSPVISEVFAGMLQGVEESMSADRALLDAHRDGRLTPTPDWPAQGVAEGLLAWRDEPATRASEAKKLADHITRQWLLTPLASTRPEWADHERFRQRAWTYWARLGGSAAASKPLGPEETPLFAEAIRHFADTLGARLLPSAEQASWDASALSAAALLDAGTTQTARAFGTSIGRLVARAAIDRPGTALAELWPSQPAALHLAPPVESRRWQVVAQLHQFKSWAATPVPGLAHKTAWEQSLSQATLLPCPHASTHESVAAFLGRQLPAPLSQWVEILAGTPLLRDWTVQDPARAKSMENLAACLALLGPHASTRSTHGWLLAQERLIRTQPSAPLEDHSADLFSLFRTQSNPLGASQLAQALDALSANHQSNPGNPWPLLPIPHPAELHSHHYVIADSSARIGDAQSETLLAHVKRERRLPATAASPSGHLVTTTAHPSPDAARLALQLPAASSNAQLRLTLVSSSLAGQAAVAWSPQDSGSPRYEPIARDRPLDKTTLETLPGGGEQFRVHGGSVSRIEIWRNGRWETEAFE